MSGGGTISAGAMSSPRLRLPPRCPWAWLAKAKREIRPTLDLAYFLCS